MVTPPVMAGAIATFTPLLGEGFSFWIVLVVFIGSAIVERLRKRAAEREAAQPPGTPAPRRTPRRGEGATPQTDPPRSATNWEEELRRLLGVEPPPSSKPPPPPPVFPTTSAQSTPPPLRVPETTASAQAPAPLARIEPKFTRAVQVSAIRLPELRESAADYQHASRLQENVARRLEQLEERMQRHSTGPEPARTTPASLEADRVVLMFRDPQAIRQAVIASMILSSPKALSAE